MSASHAAQKVHDLAECLDRSARFRGEQHQSAVIACEATQACVADIAQAQAALAPVANQALRDATVDGDRGVAWSTIGPAAVDPAAQMVVDGPPPQVAPTLGGGVGDLATAAGTVDAGTPSSSASDPSSVAIAPVVSNTVAVVHPTVSITGLMGSFIPPMLAFPYRLNTQCPENSAQRAARMKAQREARE